MPTQDGFPRQLLSQSKKARLAYFRDKIVAHPLLKEAHNALIDAISHPEDASLILVFGPTGVGKTTLRFRIEKQLIEDVLPELEENRGIIPVASMELPAPDLGKFNWRDYYKRALIALDEPLIKHKIDYNMPRLRRDSKGRLLVSRGANTSDLRWALEKCMRYRRLACFIIDEGQHFSKISSGRRLLDQMDIIKSLASITNTVHVLVGTYELLGLANLSAQLSRRSVEIHFPRYHLECSEDIMAFKSILLTFQRHLPLIKEPELVKHYEYIYAHSVGCVGIIKNWLNRTLTAALESDEKTISCKLLEKHAESTRKLLHMAREIKEGENRVDKDEGRSELRVLLGMNVVTSQTNSNSEKQGRKSISQRQSSRVGKRKPTRDLVGKAAPG